MYPKICPSRNCWCLVSSSLRTPSPPCRSAAPSPAPSTSAARPAPVAPRPAQWQGAVGRGPAEESAVWAQYGSWRLSPKKLWKVPRDHIFRCFSEGGEGSFCAWCDVQSFVSEQMSEMEACHLPKPVNGKTSIFQMHPFLNPGQRPVTPKKSPESNQNRLETLQMYPNHSLIYPTWPWLQKTFPWRQASVAVPLHTPPVAL